MARSFWRAIADDGSSLLAYHYQGNRQSLTVQPPHHCGGSEAWARDFRAGPAWPGRFGARSRMKGLRCWLTATKEIDSRSRFNRRITAAARKRGRATSEPGQSWPGRFGAPSRMTGFRYWLTAAKEIDSCSRFNRRMTAAARKRGRATSEPGQSWPGRFGAPSRMTGLRYWLTAAKEIDSCSRFNRRITAAARTRDCGGSDSGLWRLDGVSTNHDPDGANVRRHPASPSIDQLGSSASSSSSLKKRMCVSIVPSPTRTSPLTSAPPSPSNSL